MRLLMIAALLLVFAPCSYAFSQSVTIKISFLDGTTGRPLKNTQVIVYSSSDSSRPQVLKTDANGNIETVVERSASLRAFAQKGFVRSCADGNLAGPVWFEAQRILNSGIVEENNCGSDKPAAHPGTLIRMVRKSTFVEAVGEN